MLHKPFLITYAQRVLTHRCLFQCLHPAHPLLLLQPIRRFSSKAISVPPTSPSPSPLSSSPPSSSSYPPLDFDDVTHSFQSKTDLELLRALFVYRICTIRPIVTHATQLLQTSETILGKRLTESLLRHTFFAQFCAGENAAETDIVADKLEESGIGGILDYAAEADVSADKGGTGHSTASTRPASTSSRETRRLQTTQPATDTSSSSPSLHADITPSTPSSHQQQQWVHNTELFASSIKAAGQRRDGCAAIKITAMGAPDLLTTVSDHLLYHKRLFYAIQQQQTYIEQHKIPHIQYTHTLTLQQFQQGLRQHGIALDATMWQSVHQSLDPEKTGTIDYLTFSTTFSPFSRHVNTLLQPNTAVLSPLSQQDLAAFQAIRQRTDRLARLTLEHRVRLLVDAEQTYLQPAIDLLVLCMQAIANDKKVTAIPYVYNTYQCYLKDTYCRLLCDEALAEREGWIMAAKVVRGAYMRQERQRSQEMQYEDPIQPTYQHTTAHYHKTVQHILEQISNKLATASPASSSASPTPVPALVIAGHNESTVRWAAGLLSSLNIPRSSALVFFGQLLGMCDHVSYSLALSGYRVMKVCPYGPIAEVLPYLIRRAQENADVLDRATKERQLVWRELLRRRLYMFSSTTSSRPHASSTSRKASAAQSQLHR